MLSVALQVYSVRDDLDRDYDGTMGKIAAAGYKYVEMYHRGYGKTAAEVKSSLDKAGLKAVSSHVGHREILKDPEACYDFYLGIGCKYIAIPFLSDEDRSTGPNYEQVKKDIAALGEIANKKGLTLLYHNHDFEFVDYKGKLALDDLYDTVPANLLKTQIDICWAKVGGVDPAEYILKYSGRAPVVHLKDFELAKDGSVKAAYELIGEAKKGGAFPFRAVGHGCQDIPGVLKASEKAGAEWVVVEQDLPTPGKTALECAKDSFDYLKGVMK